MIIIPLSPYDNYHKGYTYQRGNRIYIKLVGDDISKNMSYPKYLMETLLDRFLEPTETVDHIDSNPLNNDFSNLQILTLQENIKKYNDEFRPVRMVTTTCAYCGKEFEIKESRANSKLAKYKYQHNQLCCSRACANRLRGKNKNV